jgi:hypothetical protein
LPKNAFANISARNALRAVTDWDSERMVFTGMSQPTPKDHFPALFEGVFFRSL